MTEKRIPTSIIPMLESLERTKTLSEGYMILKTETTKTLEITLRICMDTLKELTVNAPDSKYYKNKLRDTEEAYKELLTYIQYYRK